MRFLIFGDIFGKNGKQKIINNLQKIKQEVKPDITIANAENVSFGGKSLVQNDYQQLKNSGIDYFTMGNHTFAKEEINQYIDKVDNLVRPANYVENHLGKGLLIFTHKNKKILLFNLLGTNFMKDQVVNPFLVANGILDKNKYDIAILDFHAESTSEKIILANFLKYKLTIFYGTHTHVQTADERLINDMAYITDIGMSGILDSAIGMQFKEIENRILGISKEKFVEAKKGVTRINYIFVDVDEQTNKAVNITRKHLDVS